MNLEIIDYLDMIVSGLTAEVEAGLDPSEATEQAKVSILEHEHAEVMVEILNQRAEYIGVPISDPIENKFPWSASKIDEQNSFIAAYIKDGQDPIRELIRWAVVSKKIIIEQEGSESLSDRIKKQVIGALTSQIVREAMILGTSFGIEISQDKIKHKIREMSSEGELTRLPGGKHIPNLYAITYDGSEHDIIITGWPAQILSQKYPDMVFGDNDGIKLPSGKTNIPRVFVDSYISSSCVERAIVSSPEEFLDLILSPQEFISTIDGIPASNRLYSGPEHKISNRIGDINQIELEQVFGYRYDGETYYFVKPEYSRKHTEPPEIWYEKGGVWMRKLVSEPTVKWAFSAFESIYPKARLPSLKWPDSRTKLEMLKRKGMDDSIYRHFMSSYCWK